MRPAVFAIVVPALVLCLGGLLAAATIGYGFTFENCRFPRAAEDYWSLAKEWLLVAALIGVPYLLLVLVTASTLQTRLDSIGAAVPGLRWLVVAAVAGFTLTVMAGAASLARCNATSPAALKIFADVASFGGAALLAASAAIIVRTYIAGLARPAGPKA